LLKKLAHYSHNYCAKQSHKIWCKDIPALLHCHWNKVLLKASIYFTDVRSMTRM